MTKTAKAECTETQPLTDDQAKALYGEHVWRDLVWRKVCSECHGWVVLKKDGSLRRHKVGANL